MHAKKLTPNGSRPRSEPDLSQAATRKVDSVSSLAAEMMLRQADEGLAASPPPPPSSIKRSSWEPSVRSSVRPTPARPRGRARVAVLVVAALALVLLGSAAALVLSQ